MLPLPLFTFRNFAAANLVTAFVYGALTLGTNSSIADAAIWPLPRAAFAAWSATQVTRTREACTAKATDDPAA